MENIPWPSKYIRCWRRWLWPATLGCWSEVQSTPGRHDANDLRAGKVVEHLKRAPKSIVLCADLGYVMLFYFMLCCVRLCYVMSCLCYVTLCYMVICYVQCHCLDRVPVNVLGNTLIDVFVFLKYCAIETDAIQYLLVISGVSNT